MDTSDVINIVISVIASTGFWTFVQALVATRRTKKSAAGNAMLALLHDRLYYLMQEYILKGSITADEYENITYLYVPYTKLGGNGTCERLLKEVEKLRIR